VPKARHSWTSVNAETVNHKGHEVREETLKEAKTFVMLRALSGSWEVVPGFAPGTTPTPDSDRIILPLMTITDEIIERERRFLLPTYNRYPIALERGKGVFLYDREGIATWISSPD
jgi:hypothetical protein